MVRQSGLLPRGDAKGDSAALASYRASGGSPHEELPLAQRKAFGMASLRARKERNYELRIILVSYTSLSAFDSFHCHF